MKVRGLILAGIMVLVLQSVVQASDFIYLGIFDMHADKNTLMIQWFNPSSTVCMMVYSGPGLAQRRIGLEFKELWKEDRAKIDQARAKLAEMLKSDQTFFTIDDFSKRLGLTYLRSFPIGEQGL